MNSCPKNPVPCRMCGDPLGFPKKGLCRKCQGQHLKKYHWTENLDAELTHIYQTCARRRRHLTVALRSFGKKLGWPVAALTNRAARLGITRFQTHPWTSSDEAKLAEMAGTRSMEYISKILKRSPDSIRLKLWKLGRRGTCKEGYATRELATLMGVSPGTVYGWLERGWLRRSEMISGRITERAVARFLEAHAEEYDLRRVDQAWFKGMIFPSFGFFAHGLGNNAAAHNPYKEIA